MNSRVTQRVRSSTGGVAPRIAEARSAAKHSAPSTGGVKKQRAVRTDITRNGGDGKTRAGERKRKAAVVEGDKDKEKVMGRVEAYLGRKKSIESIMSETSVEKTLESILTESDEDEDEDEGAVWCGSAVEKKKGCRKRKAGRKSLGLSSSSSSSDDDDDDDDDEEAEIVDGTDVLDDAKKESKGTVIPSSLPESEEEPLDTKFTTSL